MPPFKLTCFETLKMVFNMNIFAVAMLSCPSIIELQLDLEFNSFSKYNALKLIHFSLPYIFVHIWAST